MKKIQKSEEKRQRILDALLKIAYKEGIDQVTYQKVAKVAKLSYYLVHYYYGKGPVSLLDAGIDHVGKRAQEYISNYITTNAKKMKKKMIHQYITGTFKWSRDFPEQSSFWIYYYHLCSRRKDMIKLNQELIHNAYIRIERLIREDIGREHYPILDNIDDLAEVLHNHLMGSVIKFLTVGNKVQFDGFVQKVLKTSDELIMLHERHNG